MSQTSVVTYEAEAQEKIKLGIEQVYQVAKAAYGPKAGNVGIEMGYGEPLISRDGVTNLERVFPEDPIERMAARIIVQASRQNNQKAGDGTTVVTILAYHLYLVARMMISGGHNRMEVAKRLEEAAVKAIEYIDSIKKPVTEDLLKAVAIISAGDPAIGEMIADVINEVGADGGISVEDFPGLGIHSDIVDGFYFQKGFANPNLINDYSNLQAYYENAYIFITEHSIRTANEIATILKKVTDDGIKELVIIGELGDEAIATLVLNKIRALKGEGGIATTVVEPPVFGGNRSLFLEDLAILTDGKVYQGDAKGFSKDMLGMAKTVRINEFSTTIIGADGDASKVKERIKQLKKQQKEALHPSSQQAIKDRLAKLTGKIAIIRVGGATEIEQKEVKLRVEDSVCAVQAAIRDGIVPGGGVTMARISGTDFDSAFREPFKQLAHNAGLNAEGLLAKLLEADTWDGYNLRKDDVTTPTNLLDEGVIDPALVMKEAIRNAVSVVSKLITMSAVLTIKREK